MPTRSSFIRNSLKAVAVAALTAFGSGAWAQAYPDKPVRLVLSVPPGGSLDALARVVAEGAAKRLGQTVIVDNRAGGTGAIAIGYVTKQPADGYTLYLTADAAFTLVPVVRKMAYKPIDDFTFISRVAFAPNVLAVPASLNVKDLKEFVALAKAKPGRLNYGMMLGTPQHLDFERFKQGTGTYITLIPFTGGAPILTSLLGGTIEAALFNPALFAEHVRSGKLRALATTTSKRLVSMPDVPTLAEAGFPNLKMEEGQLFAIVGPAGMPKPIVDKLNQVFAETLADPQVKKRLEDAGWEVSPGDGETFKKLMQRQLADNEKMVKAMKIQLTD